MRFIVKNESPRLGAERRRLLTALMLVTLILAACASNCSPRNSNNSSNTNTPHGSGSEHLEGMVSDSEGNPLSGLSVGIQNGPKAQTDAKGVFVLNGVKAGDQVLVIQPRSGHSQMTLNLNVKEGPNPKTNVIYNVDTSRLGLLAITAPVDGAILDVRKSGNEHRATVYGRCDGLADALGTFDVWVLVRSTTDLRYWVQRPPALVDASANTWRAGILLGSPEHPPLNGESWDIIAVAARADSDMGRIINTPGLNLLPTRITSNVVTVKIKIITQ